MSVKDVVQVGQVVQAVAAALTILLAGGGLLLGLLRRTAPVREFWLRRPLARARVALDGHTRDALDKAGGARGRLLDVLSRRMVEGLAADHALPADILADVIAEVSFGRRAQGPAGVRAWWTGLAPPLAALLHAATAPQASSLLARVLYPDEIPHLREMLGGMRHHVDRFAASTPVDADRLAAAEAEGLRTFASVLTGAIVLVDGTATRAGCAETVQLWHVRHFRGAHRYRDGEDVFVETHGAIGYEDLHRPGEGCGAWETKGRPPGDFDQRVLELRSAALTEATTRGYTAIVLETAETCYAVTERGGEQGQGCKNIVPSTEPDALTPRIVRGGDSTWVVPTFGRKRGYMLTAYVALITADEQLALADRTSRVRHGADGLSATAGGVCEPGGPGTGGDCDALGMPDPEVTILRETREEIGLGLDPGACRPAAVFLSNVRGRTARTRDDGQLVAVVLYVGRTDLDFRTLRTLAAAKADFARGSFEQRDLVACPVAAPDGAAEWAVAHAKRLDQHGMLSCLYASALLHDSEETRRAFEDAFTDEPWWARSPEGFNTARLVRPPESLVEDSPAITSPASWLEHMAHLRL